MLGNMHDAKIIYEAQKKLRMPRGWKFLGAGAYRRCYLSPDGVVYKIAKDYFHSEDAEPNENDEEYMTYKRVRLEKPVVPGWRLARMKPYYLHDDGLRVTINGMEYIRGTHEPEPTNPNAWGLYENWISTAFGSFGLLDWGSDNYVLANNGKRVIVDYVR